MIVDITETQLYTKLRAFVASVVPAGVAVIRGQINRVAMPAGAFVQMQIMHRRQLRTNVHTYDDPTLAPGARTTETGMRLGCDFNFYGPASGDQAQMFVTMWRDPYGCDFLAPECQPLYCDEARQIALVNGEDQYEQRWVVRAQLQYNPRVSLEQQFADAATVQIIEVDATYPP